MSDKPLISFDYAIKYLLKNKSDYEIVEAFISALLKSEGYGPVKIKALLDTESNKETANLKKSIADLIVEDEQGKKYIVEVERAYTSNFIHKACFNSSRLIVDSIESGEDYTTIKKVFHISLLYFIPDNIKSALSHGKTIFKTVETKETIDLHISDLYGEIFDLNILPEYFLITVPMFNNVVKQEIDEWLYIMKNSELKSDFKSPCMKKVKDRLSVLTMDPVERDAYYRYMKEVITQRDAISAAEIKGVIKGRDEGIAIGRDEGIAIGRDEGIAIGRDEGIAIGRDEGKKAALLETAKQMLARGLDVDFISQITNLSKDDISNLKK